MKIEDVLGIRIQGHDAIEIKFRGQVIWPLNYIYVISNVRLVYYIDGNYTENGRLYADGSNYALVLCTVVTRQGARIISTETNVPMVPELKAGTGCYISGNQIKGSNRGKNEGAQITGMVYATIHGQTWQNIMFYQEANEKNLLRYTKTTTGYAISVSGSSEPFSVKGSTKSLSGQRKYTRTNYWEWTSHATETETIPNLYESQLPDAVTINPNSGLSYRNGILTAASNQYMTNIRSWSVTGTFDGFTSSAIYLGQSPDSYSAKREAVTDSYYAYLTKLSGAITAAGGSQGLRVDAGHTEVEYHVWASDGWKQEISREAVTDSPTVKKSGDTYNGFSYSGGVVSHISMEDNSRFNKQGQDVTESATFSINNGGVTASQMFSATNYYTKGMEVDQVEIELSQSTIDYTAQNIGGHIVSRTYREDSYTSGTKVPVYTLVQRTIVSSQSWAVPYPAQVSGSTNFGLVVEMNPNTSDRSVTLTLGDQTVTLTQTAAPQPIAWDTQLSCSYTQPASTTAWNNFVYLYTGVDFRFNGSIIASLVRGVISQTAPGFTVKGTITYQGNGNGFLVGGSYTKTLEFSSSSFNLQSGQSGDYTMNMSNYDLWAATSFMAYSEQLIITVTGTGNGVTKTLATQVLMRKTATGWGTM